MAKVKEAISASGHVIVDMAGFPAADQNAARLCTDRVRECEVYVGVLGTRYGSLVPGRPDVSYTELEFDAATAEGLDRLVFLLDTDAVGVGIPLSKSIDHEFGARQDEFRRRVQNSVVTQSFADPVTLGWLVERSLQDLARRRAYAKSEIRGARLSSIGDSPVNLAAEQVGQPPLAAEAPGLPTPRSGPETGQVVVGNIPGEFPGYRQRKDLLAELDAPRRDRYASIVRSLTGLLGVGKTQLAAEYARAKAHDGWPLVAWINASDEVTVLNGLTEVAAVLGLKTYGPDAGAPGRAVRRRLEADGDRCLMVFNDVADLELIRPFLPAVGNARIVITTNLEKAAANLGTSIRVPVFSESDALAFLAEQTGLADAEGAQAVTVQLGCLPLALAQAAAVISGQHLEYAVYLDRLRRLPVERMLPPIKADSYTHGLAAAVLLSLDSVRGDDDTGKVSVALMEMMSVLARGGVPRDLLRKAAQPDLLERTPPVELSEVAVDEALARLAGSSLLTFSVDDERISAHRLVMRVISDRMKEEKRIAIACETVGDALISWAEVVRQEWEHRVVSDLVDQINTLVEHMGSLPGERDRGSLRRLLQLRLERARFLDDLGQSPEQAVEDGKPLLEDAERGLGPDDLCTITCRHNLAIAYQQAGRFDEAIELYERNAKDREDALGANDRNTLASRNSLATAYHDAGRYDDAIELYERNLKDRKRFLGTNHPDTRASKNNLAVAYQDTGRIEEAIRLHQQNIPNRVRILYTGTLDHKSLAIPLHELTRADGKRTIGLEHPDALGYRNNLATAYFEAGHIGEAARLLEFIREDKERKLGLHHPSTLISRSNLAIAYLEAGRAHEAVELLDEVRADCKRVLGTKHRTTRIVNENLAIARRAVRASLTGPA